MRPFPQSGSKCLLAQRLTLYSLLACVAICHSGCANVASIPTPPPGSQAISVTVTPTSGSVMLGNQFLFTAAVKNSSDSAVTWSVNGVAGGGAQTGTITSGGVYTAPGDLPIPPNLTVTATSHADVSKSGTAIVTVQSDVSISLPSGGGTGAVPVELGATHAFLAVVSSGAHPDKSVLWSVSGPSCPLLCGSVDASGNYTAPQMLPGSPNVTLTARSVADSSRQVSATITITSNFTATLGALNRTGLFNGHVHRDAQTRAGIKPKHRSFMELIRRRMQRSFVWDVERGDGAIRGGKCYCCVGKLYRTYCVPSAEYHRGYRHTPC
jgi:hypothetical protein